jgi:hypothetical protein
MSSNDPESSDEDIATEQGKHLPPLSDWLYRYQEPDAGPAKKEWTKCWCVLQNRKLLYFKSKVDPASGELPEGYVQLQGSKVSLQSIKKSKCGLTITEVRQQKWEILSFSYLSFSPSGILTQCLSFEDASTCKGASGHS